MAFEMGKTYKLDGGDGTIVLRFISRFDDMYQCRIVGGTHSVAEEKLHETLNVHTSSRILRWKCTEVEETEKTSGITPQVIEKAKRRSKEEIAMDNFLDGLLLRGRVDRLKRAIDGALAANDKTGFMKLSKELQKLTKKVTA